MNNFTDSQQQYLEGQKDGERYYAAGHVELRDKYDTGTPVYRMGFESQQCKHADDFAS